MFSRENRRPKTVKFKIYFNFEGCRGFRCGSLFGAVVVSTGPEVGRASRLQDLPDVGSGPAVCVPSLFPAFCLLSCFALVVLLANMPLFGVLRGFLAGFGVRMYICMGWGLCVDCGAFVCVSG